MATTKSGLKLLAHTILLAYETTEYRRAWERDEQAGSFERVVERSLLVEEAGFDGIFFGDAPSVLRATLATSGAFPFEPFTLLSALAARTTRLGFIGTIATQYNDPYNVARRFASLDQISGGRSGWNAVTGFYGERNFGFDDIISPADRYRRAEEFVDVVKKLWTSWKPGYLAPDAEQGLFYDVDKIENVEHRGEFFSVEGPLNIPPSPQGHPVVVQAGGSENGLELAGRHGELIYTAAPTFEHGVQQVATYRDKAEANGRDRHSIKIVPGLYAYIGATHEEALANRAATVTDRELLNGLALVALEYDGFELDGLDLDHVLRPEDLPSREEILASARRTSRALLYLEFATRPGATLRSFLTEVVTGTGHTNIVGSYDEVADELERWHAADAADGFVLMGTNSLQEFLDEIVPRLEAKGIYDRRPDLTTFRSRLDLPEVGAHVQTVGAPA